MPEIGQTISHYRITEKLGQGGMGEVYQAKDQKLGRDVAIKVLPEEFAKDTDRVARFQREAKLLASLNHPNIAAIHGLEESGGTNFLILELVQGEALANRLKRGPIPVEESLKLALQIAEALEAAHEKGVIHRDLKPANIKVTPDGTVKVLDFGLAKAFAGEQEEANPANSPTLSDAATQQGVILGTAAYMSPEQAKAKPVDKRADIWAFGVVLFEMLTGRQLFKGETVSETLAAVLMREPEFSTLPQNLHPRIRFLLERCLEKQAKNRCHDISDVRVDIQKVLADPSGVSGQSVATREGRTRLRLMLPWVAAAIVLTGIIVGVAVWKLKPPEPRQVVRFDCQLPEGQQLTAKLIPGTEGNQELPFFSPDGQWIGYFSPSDGKLKKISINGGAPVVLCSVTGLAGATWQKDNTVVFGQLPNEVKRISANGGNPESLTKLETGYFIVLSQILPDGKSVLYTSFESGQERILVQSLIAGRPKELLAGIGARFLPTGHMVYVLNDNVLAVPFDPDRLEVIGGTVPVVESVSDCAFSDSGTMAYIPNAAPGTPYIRRTLVWVDREGKEEPIGAGPDSYLNPRISPDGKRIALSTQNQGNQDIWIWDLVRKNLTRLTFDTADEVGPLWTPDGKRIAFFSIRGEKVGVHWKAADGTGKDEFLGGGHYPASWSDHGRTMVLMEWDIEALSYGIGTLSIEGDRKLRMVLKEKYHEAQPRISPDGRWMAYTSNESGLNQVYVRPFPEVEGGRWQVSTSGGDSPLWSPDGRELFFRNGDAVVAASAKTDPAFSVETPKMLFRGTYVNAVLAYDDWDFATWDVSPDGKQFLMMKETGAAATGGGRTRKINVVLNWFEELKQRVPVK
jgi:serine/threonine-protein kinase